jgi:hypothetical protein
METALVLLPRFVQSRAVDTDGRVRGEYSQSLQIGLRGGLVYRERGCIQAEDAQRPPREHKRDQEH